MPTEKKLIGFLAVVRQPGKYGMDLAETFFHQVIPSEQTLTPGNWKQEISNIWNEILEGVVGKSDLSYICPDEISLHIESDHSPIVTMALPVFLPTPLIEIFDRCEDLVEGINGHRDFPKALADFLPLGRKNDLPSLTDFISALTAEILKIREGIPEHVPYGKYELEITP